MPWEKCGDLVVIQLRYSETREYKIKYIMIVDESIYNPQEMFDQRPTVLFIRYRIQDVIHEIKYYLSEMSMQSHNSSDFIYNSGRMYPEENLGIESHMEGFVMRHLTFSHNLEDYDPSYIYNWVPPTECPIKLMLREVFARYEQYNDEYELQIAQNMRIFL